MVVIEVVVIETEGRTEAAILEGRGDMGSGIGEAEEVGSTFSGLVGDDTVGVDGAV